MSPVRGGLFVRAVPLELMPEMSLILITSLTRNPCGLKPRSVARPAKSLVFAQREWIHKKTERERERGERGSIGGERKGEEREADEGGGEERARERWATL